MEQFDLDDRQKQSVLIAKKGVQISNKDYRVKFRVSKSTASRDLDSLVSKGIFEKVGTTGKGTYYMLSGKGLIKGSKSSSGDAETQTAHKGLKGLISVRDEVEKTGNTQGAISGKTTQETTQERIVACLIDSPTLTRRALASNIGITEDGIKYHLAKLTKAKLIRHLGPTKTGHWEILK